MTVRLVQVGVGPWGLNWAASVVPQVVEVMPVAWVDTSPKALEALQGATRVASNACFTSLEQALAAIDADAVLVTTSLPGHVPVARAALEAGKHVMIEKPMAANPEEAELLADLADEVGLVLMANQNYRYYPAAQTAMHLVQERALGEVHDVHVEFRRYAATEGYRYYDMQHPLLVDMAIHHFDLMRMILGCEPVKVYCQSWNPSGSGFANDPSASAVISFENGSVVTYQGSWVSPGATTPYAGEWFISCERGEIFWTGRGDRDLTTGYDRVEMRPLGEAVQKPTLAVPRYFGRAGSLAAFTEAIETGNLPPGFSSGRDNAGSLALMGAAVTSAACGYPIEIGSRVVQERVAHEQGLT